ncbi:hypothetical protein K491DRAFT_732759 [Lophiostoma macrostomum CBS 122681]|uniref:Uncharacterized protein n=1 Tax=Lophiostoma macrostomum CBS 122681 TaxID=1314788 RepID=A0A6A6SQN5_9PLEO|nr:hypothetical protein K491DRAFT_732759 [Lophiostoma macrostomum CBS 122681]
MPYLITTPSDPFFPYILPTPPPSPRSLLLHPSSSPSSSLSSPSHIPLALPLPLPLFPTQSHLLLRDAQNWADWSVEYKTSGSDAYSQKYWKERFRLEQILWRDVELRDIWREERAWRIMEGGDEEVDGGEFRRGWRTWRERAEEEGERGGREAKRGSGKG